MESIALWQGLTLCGIVSWIFISSCLNVTQKLRTLVQPWVSHHVITGTPIILQIQVSINFYHHKRTLFLVLNSVCEVFFLFTFFSHFCCFFFLPLSFCFCLQKYQHGFLDALFSGLSCVVSVPFYTAFLPLLFWVCFISFCLVVILDFYGSFGGNWVVYHVEWTWQIG